MMARTGKLSVLVEACDKGHLVACPLHPHGSFAGSGPKSFPVAFTTSRWDRAEDFRPDTAHVPQSRRAHVLRGETR